MEEEYGLVEEVKIFLAIIFAFYSLRKKNREEIVVISVLKQIDLMG